MYMMKFFSVSVTANPVPLRTNISRKVCITRLLSRRSATVFRNDIEFAIVVPASVNANYRTRRGLASGAIK
jgi:hypothetical protein